tara:strand:- start:100 stop:432 length:333 start_codon:yes stop_codon:yes gene_type:complete
MKTADDFNKEAAAKAVPVAAKPESEKKPKMINGKFICANKGCVKRTFLEEENGENVCKYHSGDAVFHDLKKYWSCCNPNGDSGKGKIAYDWDEFMTLDTCCVGSHVKKMI